MCYCACSHGWWIVLGITCAEAVANIVFLPITDSCSFAHMAPIWIEMMEIFGSTAEIQLSKMYVTYDTQHKLLRRNVLLLVC